MASESCPQMFVATSTSTEITTPVSTHIFPTPAPPPPPPLPPAAMIVQGSPLVVVGTSGSLRLSSGGKKAKEADLLTQCNVCDMPGTPQNLVMFVINNIYVNLVVNCDNS